MGSDFAGAMASSQAFFSFNVSISSVEGALRGEGCTALVLLLCCCLWEVVKPGGSGMLDLAGCATGAELRSSTQWGGGGGLACTTDMIAT